MRYMNAFFLRAIAVIGFGAVLLSAPAADAADMNILVVDQQAILRDSLAGQDVSRQATVLRDQIGQEIETEQKAIIAAEQSLEADAKVLSESQRNERANQIIERRRSYPVFEQRKGQVLQLSVARATNEIAATLKPLLQEIIDERKADLLIDRTAVMFVAKDYDITEEATNRLNAKLKSVKLERVELDGGAGQSGGDANNN